MKIGIKKTKIIIKLFPQGVWEALEDLHKDSDLLFVLQVGPYNNSILNEDGIRIQEALLNTQKLLIERGENNSELIKTLLLYNLKWFEGQINLLNEDMTNSITAINEVRFRTKDMKVKYDKIISQLQKL